MAMPTSEAIEAKARELHEAAVRQGEFVPPWWDAIPEGAYRDYMRAQARAELEREAGSS